MEILSIGYICQCTWSNRIGQYLPSAKVMFYISHSVHSGGVGNHPPGRYTPWEGTPLPQAGTPPGRYTPRQVHPQAGTPPGGYSYPPRERCILGDRATSGRYTSYCNAFFFPLKFFAFQCVFKRNVIQRCELTSRKGSFTPL